MSSFAKANELYQQGKYQEALDLYIKLQNIYGNFVVGGNIQRCRTKLQEQDKNVDTRKPSAEYTWQGEEEAHIKQLIRQADDYFLSMPPLSSRPLVSVIMTSHNTEKYIESSIYSLIDQSYGNLEIIVVDDCSSDGTIEILDRLSRSFKQVKLFRLNSNLGTYYAKNLGITKSKGEIIFFQDSDDICHKNRIEICLQALQSRPEAVAVRAAYARVNPTDSSIVEVDGCQYKLGLITLGVRRFVFSKIGFFNCTTRASDDEFFNRIKCYYKKSSIVDVSQPLYFNTMREGSLIADMVDWKGESSIKQNPSISRANYVKKFTEIHKDTSIRFADRFVFPAIRDILLVDDDMTKLSNPRIPVYISVCSIPERESKLKRVINALYNQCDSIHVYLDGYKSIPKFLLNDKKITIVSCQDKNLSIRDNGKFMLLDKLIKGGKDGYYITVDDDINYPLDYVNTMIKRLNYYNDKVVLGVHGILLPKNLDRYFSKRRKVFSFYRKLEQDKLVHILGTGTTIFRVREFDGFSLSDLTHTGMADVFLAIECSKRSLPQIAIARYEDWLSEMERDTKTLFAEFKDDDCVQTDLLIRHGVVENNLNYVNVVSEDLADKLPALSILDFYE